MNLTRRATELLDLAIASGGFWLLNSVMPGVGNRAGHFAELVAQLLVAAAVAIVFDLLIFSLPRIRIDWFVAADQIPQAGPELRHQVSPTVRTSYKVEVTCRRLGLFDRRLMARFLRQDRTVIARIDPKGSVKLAREAAKTHRAARVLTSQIRFPLDPAESDGVFSWATVTLEPKNTPDDLVVRCCYEITPRDAILDRLVLCRGRVRTIRLVRS